MVASPSLAHLIWETAKRVSHPTVVGKTLWDARTDRGVFYGNFSNEAIAKLNAEMDIEIANEELSSVKPLGSGSDFTVFLQRIGVRCVTLVHLFRSDFIPQVASLGIGFGSTLSDAVYHYHSVFDSGRWMEVYGDPAFTRHVRNYSQGVVTIAHVWYFLDCRCPTSRFAGVALR